MEAKRRIKKFKMDGDAAVALVSKNVGGACNNYSTLLMKSTDVVVELSMAEYLSKFFDIWSYDAKIISKLLGYSDDYELWDEEELMDKTTILQKMKESEEYEEEDMKQVAPLMKSLAKASNFKISDIDNILKDANGEDPISDNNVEAIQKASETSPKEEVNMTTEMIEKSVYETELAKAVAAKEAELVAIQKGLEDQLAVFTKAKQDAEKAEYIEKAKSLEVAGIEGDAVEAMAVAMQKAAAGEDTKVLVETILKMATLIKNVDSLEDVKGHSAEAAVSEDTGVMALIKSKKQTK